MEANKFCKDPCKYFDTEMILIVQMISFLYDDLEECCGGLCHIVTDDDNIEDHSLQFVIEECSKEENKDRNDARVAKYICESMLKLTMMQREFLFGLYKHKDADDVLDTLKFLQYNGCLYCRCNGDNCPHKNALNRFHAESECLDQTGNNSAFLSNNWPIKEVE